MRGIKTQVFRGKTGSLPAKCVNGKKLLRRTSMQRVRPKYQCFSWLSHPKNWQGYPLIDIETIVDLITATTTEKGLKIDCQVDNNAYTTGRKITDEELSTINLYSGETLEHNADIFLMPIFFKKYGNFAIAVKFIGIKFYHEIANFVIRRALCHGKPNVTWLTDPKIIVRNYCPKSISMKYADDEEALKKLSGLK